MSFSCDYDADDTPEFYRRRDVVARTEHVCGECAEVISKEAPYCYESGVWEGVFLQFYTCERCVDLRDSYVALGFCYVYGDLWADHLENLVESGEKNSTAADMARTIIIRRRELNLLRLKSR